jgi:uncharacterized cupin superfamily protein
MKIEIKKPSDQDLEKRGVFSWPIWEKEKSRFDWYYDRAEECYLLEGKVVVEIQDGEKVEFKLNLKKEILFHFRKGCPVFGISRHR